MTVILFLGGLLLIGGAVMLLMRAAAFPRLRAEQTIAQITDYGYAQGMAEADEGRGSLFGPLDQIASAIGLLFGRWLGLHREAQVRKGLIAAGMYRIDPRRLVGYQLLLGAGGTLFALWVFSAGSSTGIRTVFFAALTGVVGWYFPLLLVKRRARERLDAIEYDLPELIDLLVVGVEAGLSFSAALQATTQRLRGPLGQEMRLMLQEQRMGLSSPEALRNVLERVETPSMRTFVRAMVQGEQLGISVGQILRSIAIEMRSRRKAAAEERAQKAPVKMLFPLIFLIFPAMFVVILGPALFAFFDALGG
jgi:tight adherence protein C